MRRNFDTGIRWWYTVFHPTLFLNLGGEFLFLFITLLYVRSWLWFYTVIFLAVSVMVLGAFGYNFRALLRRINRWWIGPNRPIHNNAANINRVLRGE